MSPPIWLVVAAPTGLGLAGVLAEGRRRRILLALALASVPLTLLIWRNVAAAPELMNAPTTGPLAVGTLRDALATFAIWGLGPAAAAWAILRLDDDHPVARSVPEPGMRAGIAAALTLGLIASFGAGLTGLRRAGMVSAVTAGAWSAVPPGLLVGLAVVVAVIEETLFRGVLQSSLLPVVGAPVAAVVQAALFGFVHAGYGDPWYVLGAAAFGLVQAYIALKFGLLVAVATHAQLNLVVLGWLSHATFAVNGWIAATVVLVNVVVLGLVVWRSIESEPDRPAMRIGRWVQELG